jgi:hypothetical protein
MRSNVTFSNCPNGIFSINKNYFRYNSGWHGAFYCLTGSTNVLLSENEFFNNSGQLDDGVITISAASSTIECNKIFYCEADHVSSVSIIGGSNNTIRNNIFYGNKCTFSASFTAMVSLNGTNNAFINNYVYNDTTLGGPTIKLVGSGPCLVSGNEFNNNLANTEIGLYQSAIISGNSFMSANTYFAIVNYNGFSGPPIDADSNYWGSTSTQHVDSIIYDFFDDSNRSIVNYSPILTAPAVIDTTCTPDFPTAIASDVIIKQEDNSTLFPNPFTTTATIKFSHALRSATFRLYNLYGQLVQEKNNINGESFCINRETLCSGVYVYEVTDTDFIGAGKEKKICTGKAVIY